MVNLTHYEYRGLPRTRAFSVSSPHSSTLLRHSPKLSMAFSPFLKGRLMNFWAAAPIPHHRSLARSLARCFLGWLASPSSPTHRFSEHLNTYFSLAENILTSTSNTHTYTFTPNHVRQSHRRRYLGLRSLLLDSRFPCVARPMPACSA